MKIYCSGITNKAGLEQCHKFRTELYKFGINLFLPGNMEQEKTSWSENLQNRLKALKQSDAIYMYPGWKESIMARIELTAAMNDKMPACFSFEELKQCITTLSS